MTRITSWWNKLHPGKHGKGGDEDKKKSSSPSSGGGSVDPLRHLESLSLGHFTNLMNHHAGSVAAAAAHEQLLAKSLFTPSSLSFHAPGLGLDPSSILNARVGSGLGSVGSGLGNVGSGLGNPGGGILAGNHHHQHGTTVSQQGDTGDSRSEEGKEGMDEDQEGLLSGQDDDGDSQPFFRDSTGMIEVPVDRDNPRRCTACGKIFQNHFGVKTHYQVSSTPSLLSNHFVVPTLSFHSHLSFHLFLPLSLSYLSLSPLSLSLSLCHLVFIHLCVLVCSDSHSVLSHFHCLFNDRSSSFLFPTDSLSFQTTRIDTL